MAWISTVVYSFALYTISMGLAHFFYLASEKIGLRGSAAFFKVGFKVGKEQIHGTTVILFL
jgi:hypothetical protein